MDRDALFGAPQGGPAFEEIELLGPHLRVHGLVDMGRFSRLADLVNQGQGYLRLTDARLLRRNGDPTNLTMSELLVNRDEITFIGQQADAAHPARPAGAEVGEFAVSLERTTRRYVIFTPGHTITGDVQVYREITLGTFLQSPDPRFVAMSSVTARSLADRRVISHFDLLLVNKAQMTAAAEADQATSVAD